MAKKRKKVLLSSFSIILILIFVLGIISHLLPNAKFVGEEIINGSGTVGAKLSQILMAPILGFEDAIDIAIFIMMLLYVSDFSVPCKGIKTVTNHHFVLFWQKYGHSDSFFLSFHLHKTIMLSHNLSCKIKSNPISRLFKRTSATIE